MARRVRACDGISGLQFEYVAAHPVRLTPPGEMEPAAPYPGLAAEVVSVTEDDETPDLRERAEELPGEPATTPGIAIHIRVRNDGAAVVEQARLRLQYLEAADDAAPNPAGASREPVAEWILDMPSADWNPYRLPGAPQAACEPSDPLLPGCAHEFAIVHYRGGPHDWARQLDATSVDVLEVRLRS